MRSIDTPFIFNGTHLVRIDKNPIPLGYYRYFVACTYNSVFKLYYSYWERFHVIDYCKTEQGQASYKTY